MRVWLWNTCVFLILGSVLPAGAAEALTSENIAVSAMRVAQATNTTGYCYAAVSKAMRPFDMNLYGAAAYEARDLLSQDRRFVPLSIASVDYLRRGDIIVFNRSDSHPYGHISVYQGNDLEASDHVAKIARSQPYGGATVFRLCEDWSIDDVPIQVAPDFNPRFPYLANYPATASHMPEPVKFDNESSIARKSNNSSSTGRNYGKTAALRVTNILLRRCVNALFN